MSDFGRNGHGKPYLTELAFPTQPATPDSTTWRSPLVFLGSQHPLVLVGPWGTVAARELGVGP